MEAGPVRFCGVSHVTATLGTTTPEVGDIFTVGDEVYQWVYNAGNSQINPGHGCVFSAVTGYSVTVSSTTLVDFCVGVCKHATITTGTYGFLMKRGFVAIEMGANASAATGELVTLDADGCFVAKSISTGYPTPCVGKLMVSCASGASGSAYINVL